MKNLRNGLVLSLALLSVISMGSVAGTYAKYTTTLTEQTDSARVAKWTIGQTTNVENLFTSSYEASDAAAGETDVLALVDVVAPGTNGEYSFNLSGTTETNYTLTVVATATDTINTVDYAPITYTLDGEAVTDMNADSVINAQDLALAIAALYPAEKVYVAGTVSESVHTIGWSWAIDGDDAKDTVLGNEIALDEDSHKVSLSVTITATQSELKGTN